MTEDEYTDLMRKALREPQLFAQLTATPEDQQQAYEWLMVARKQVKEDLGRRKAERAVLGANVQAGRTDQREYKKYLADDAAWRKRALGFQGVLDRHIDALKSGARGRNLVRISEEREAYRVAVLRLAQAIQAHQAERIADGDLYGLLDEIKMPFGLQGELSLRDALNAWLVKT